MQMLQVAVSVEHMQFITTPQCSSSALCGHIVSRFFKKAKDAGIRDEDVP